jgi:hypothetical protein
MWQREERDYWDNVRTCILLLCNEGYEIMRMRGLESQKRVSKYIDIKRFMYIHMYICMCVYAHISKYF